jgi:hypothetical protein
MKKPKIPTHVLIGNVRYSIEPLPESEKEEGVRGRCSNVLNHRIQIDTDQIGEQAVDTLFHEMLHAMVDVYRMKLSHKQIYKLAGAFSHMASFNPGVLHWMMKTIDYEDLEGEEA